MVGAVYELTLSAEDGGLPHPHVIVLPIGGDRECLVVPAYSCDGHQVNAHIDLRRRLGDPDRCIFVELNNAQVIDAVGLFTGKQAYWCGSRARRLPQAWVGQQRLIGQMQPGPLLQVAECVLAFVQAHPSELAKNARRNLQAAINALRAKSDTPDH